MDGLTLLDRAAAAGLRIEVTDSDMVLRGPKECSELVEAIRDQKAAVIAELRRRSIAADAAKWNRLTSQRWGPGEPTPGRDVPAEGWRWEVARWPIRKWLAWHRRVNEITPPGARAEAIEAAQHQAYDELIESAEPSFDLTMFKPLTAFDIPAWIGDESLSVSLTAVHASIEHDQALRRAETKPLHHPDRAGPTSRQPSLKAECAPDPTDDTPPLPAGGHPR